MTLVRLLPRTLALTVAAVLAVAVASPAAAEEVPEEELENSPNPAQHCLSLIRIDRTETLDDQHMVFHTSGDEIYLNTLSNPCPGLDSSSPYMVRSSTDRLCNLDIITVLHTTGIGFMPGASCGLNMFEPITDNQLTALKSQLGSG